jgi:hypothetical protein
MWFCTRGNDVKENDDDFVEHNGMDRASYATLLQNTIEAFKQVKAKQLQHNKRNRTLVMWIPSVTVKDFCHWATYKKKYTCVSQAWSLTKTAVNVTF